MKIYSVFFIFILQLFTLEIYGQSLNLNEIDFLISTGKYNLAQRKLDEIQKIESDPRLKLTQSRLWEEEARKLEELGDLKGALRKLEQANLLWSNRTDLTENLKRTKSLIKENYLHKDQSTAKNELESVGSPTTYEVFSDLRKQVEYIFYIVITLLLTNILFLYFLIFRKRHV
jgi:hypothetical protein